MHIISLARAASVSDVPSRSSDFPPINFDASACPILAQLWFNLRPDVAAEGTPGDPRFQEAQAA